MGIIKKLFGNNNKKSDDELKAEVLKKATENWNASSDHEKSFQDNVKKDAVEQKYVRPEEISQNKKKNIRTVLLAIAEGGATGILPVSISDKADISKQDTTTALAYLTDNNYAEEINSPSGMKYYITDAGRKYCISKEFNAG